MTLMARCVASLAGLMLSLGAQAAPLELSGIKVADPVEVQGSKLQLNGAGVRYKAIFKVYVAGLYLGQRAVTPEEVYAVPGAKRVSITLLREIDSNELGKNFTRGLEDNTPRSDMAKLIPALIRMGQLFSDQKKLLAGENFTIDWIPGTGTVVTVKGKVQGEPFKEAEFFNALLRIWLGPLPADLKLKDALLGKAA
jgi:hypothetical protein